jgi:hypothetical protein
MDAARAADQSWPHRNVQFRRSWSPPPERRNPALGPTSNRVVDFVSSSNPERINAETAAQRACSLAMRQADRLERRAGTLAAIGQRDAALRFSALAGQMREVAT